MLSALRSRRCVRLGEYDGRDGGGGNRARIECEGVETEMFPSVIVLGGLIFMNNQYHRYSRRRYEDVPMAATLTKL